MKRDVGFGLPSLPVVGLSRIRDLEYFDGPLLTEYRTKNQDIYLFSWCDSDRTENRWMVFRVAAPDLARFTARRYTLRRLIDGSSDGFVYLVDMDERAVRTRVQCVMVNEIPHDYLPSEHSLYDPELDPSTYSQIDLLVDGMLDLDDLALFSRRYKDAYSCICVFGLLDFDAALPNLTQDIRVGSGYGVRNSLNGVLQAVPGGMAARYKGVSCNSPGVISMQVDTHVAGLVGAAIDSVGRNYKSLWTSHNKMNRVLNKHLLMDDDDLQELLVTFVDQLGFIKYGKISAATANLIRCADIILAYYRILKYLHDLQSSGEIVLFGSTITPNEFRIFSPKSLHRRR